MDPNTRKAIEKALLRANASVASKRDTLAIALRFAAVATVGIAIYTRVRSDESWVFIALIVLTALAAILVASSFAVPNAVFKRGPQKVIARRVWPKQDVVAVFDEMAASGGFTAQDWQVKYGHSTGSDRAQQHSDFVEDMQDAQDMMNTPDV